MRLHRSIEEAYERDHLRLEGDGDTCASVPSARVDKKLTRQMRF
jgi:hypothetical protein